MFEREHGPGMLNKAGFGIGATQYGGGRDDRGTCVGRQGWGSPLTCWLPESSGQLSGLREWSRASQLLACPLLHLVAHSMLLQERGVGEEAGRWCIAGLERGHAAHPHPLRRPSLCPPTGRSGGGGRKTFSQGLPWLWQPCHSPVFLKGKGRHHILLADAPTSLRCRTRYDSLLK